MQLVTITSSDRYQDAKTCTFQGTVFAFARDTEMAFDAGGDNIVFNVLNLQARSQSDAMDWSGFIPVTFPPSLRPAGISLIEVDAAPLADVIAPAQQPFQVISDDTFIYVFRPSTAGTILVNRMLPSSEFDSALGEQRFSLSPAWEVRFRDSGKVDIPANDKDILSFTNADGEPFLEPTEELNFVSGVSDGCFGVSLVHGTSSAYWHVFTTRNDLKEMQHFSIQKGDGNTFDLSDQLVGSNGIIAPTNRFKLQTEVSGTATDLEMSFAPASELYTEREQVQTSEGEAIAAQKAVRLALAQVVSIDDKNQAAFLDIGIGSDGQINSFPDAFLLKPISPANYALSFDPFAHLTLPNTSNTLELASSFKLSVWIRPRTLEMAEQQIVGDSGSAGKDRSVFLSTFDTGRLAVGFGNGDDEIRTTSVDRLLTPGTWSLVEVHFDASDGDPDNTFTLTVNGDAVPLSNAITKTVPKGAPVTRVSAANGGCVATLDSVQIENDGTAVLDLPLNEIDFPTDPSDAATTEDTSAAGNIATVIGGELVPSNAPVLANVQGDLYVDPYNGLRTYYGSLPFVDASASPTLLNGSEGLLHLYFKGSETATSPETPSGFNVTHLNLNTQRAIFVTDWEAGSGDAKQTGQFEFLAQRAGTVMNDATIKITPRDVLTAGLCDTTIKVGSDFEEAWRGVPVEASAFQAILSGRFSASPQDARVLSGETVFYDVFGHYEQARVALDLEEKFAVLNFVTRFVDELCLKNVKIEKSGEKRKATLTFAVKKPDWPSSVLFVETWDNVPLDVRGFVDALNGLPGGASATTNLETVFLPAFSNSVGNTVSFILQSKLTAVRMEVSHGSGSETCKVTLNAKVSGEKKATVLNNVPREITQFASVLGGNDEAYDYSDQASGDFAEILPLWCPLAAGSQASIQDRKNSALSAGGLELASSLFALFQSGASAGATVVPEDFDGAASKLQSGLAGDTTALERGSQIFQAVPKSRPTNGFVALVQPTGDFTNGTANLGVSGADGGWINQPPQKGVNFTGQQYIDFSQQAPSFSALTFTQDMTAETWIKPLATTNADLLTKPQRILTMNHTGVPGNPDAVSQYSLGMMGAYSFDMGPKTFVSGASAMDGFDISLELWIKLGQNKEGGDLASVQTIGTGSSILSAALTDAGKIKVSFGTGSLETSQTLAVNTWTYVVITQTDMSNGPAGNAMITVYVNGAEDSSLPIAYDYSVKPQPGTLIVGAADFGNAVPPDLSVNVASMWSRVLTNGEIEKSVHRPLSDWSPELHIRWKFAEGSGETIRNYSRYGSEANGEVRSETGSGWVEGGIYTNFTFSYGNEAVAGVGTNLTNQWSHLAASVRRGTSLQFSNGTYAATGPTDVLNADSAASIEFWVRPDSTARTQMLAERTGSFSAQILAGGLVSVTFQTNQGPVQIVSNDAVNAYETAYFAVTFKSEMDNPPPSQPTDDPAAAAGYTVTVNIYKNGVLQGSPLVQKHSDAVSLQNQKAGLNLGRDATGSSSFSGTLAQFRFWNRQLVQGDIAVAYASRTSPTDTDGLVASWTFGEMQGRIAKDQGGSLQLVLSEDTMWAYLDAVSSILFMINGDGVAQLDRLVANDLGGYGDQQFRFGMSAGTTEVAGLSAEIDDIRLWDIARTIEQITDEQFRALDGKETGLAGYWAFNTGSGSEVEDATGRGNDGAFGVDPANPVWGVSQAPISIETGAVHNVLGGVPTGYNQAIAGAPSVVEYADLQTDAYGNVFSVMKRCYVAPQEENLMLVTGYKVGDLDTVFVGQVQTEPKIIGYFEGAPPIPSENQTMPTWNGDITEYHTYADATTVNVTIEQDVSQSVTGSYISGSSTALSGQVGLYAGTSLGASAGLGWENDWGFFEANLKLGFAFDTENATNTSKSATQGFTTTKTQTSSLTPGGYWEPEDQILNPTVGRRYIPDNLGTAVVKSRVADLYASRIKSSGQLVKLSILPNPDIPEDVNMIDFPINPAYIKNGTLDGQVGLEKDRETGVSYFRPLEAYAMKRSIEREEKQINAYLEQINLSSLATEGGFDNFVDNTLPENPAFDWSKRVSKRGLVNTYIWTAGGGTHSDTLAVADSYSEEWGSVRSSSTGLGLHAEFLIAAFVGVYGELDFMNSTTLETTGTRTKEQNSAVSLDASAAPDWFLSAPIVDGATVSYTEAPAPGKVEGYRYNAFYLPPSQSNFDFFAQQSGGVIDPVWYQQSQSPNAAALREARVADNGTWRVLYRVTYVARIPPSFQPSPDLVQTPAVRPPANLDQNTVLTQLVDQQLNMTLDPSPSDVGSALLDVLGENAASAGILGGALSWWSAFLTLGANYSNPQSVTEAELREDSLGYMLSNYETRSISSHQNVRMIASR